MPRHGPKPVLLNVSYHKICQYKWFRSGDLNSFLDIKPFMSMPGHILGDFPVSVIKCILSRRMPVYG